MKRKYALLSILSWVLCAILLGSGLIALGTFDRSRVVVATLATTGPDYEVVMGQWKLASQMPDTIESMDVGGIMVTGEGASSLGQYLSEHWRAFADGGYFVVDLKMVGVEHSDSAGFHPLVEIISWKHVGFHTVIMFLVINVGLLQLSAWFYRRYKVTATLPR